MENRIKTIEERIDKVEEEMVDLKLNKLEHTLKLNHIKQEQELLRKDIIENTNTTKNTNNKIGMILFVLIGALGFYVLDTVGLIEFVKIAK